MSNDDPHRIPSVPSFDPRILRQAHAFASASNTSGEAVANEIALLRFLLTEALALLADPFHMRDIRVAGGRDAARPGDERVRALENTRERLSVTDFGTGVNGDILPGYFATRIDAMIDRIDSGKPIF